MSIFCVSKNLMAFALVNIIPLKIEKSIFSTLATVTSKSSTRRPSGGSKKRKHRKPKHRKRRTKAKKYK